MFQPANPTAAGLPPTSLADVLRSESNHRIANNLALVAGLLNLHARQLGKREMPLAPREAAAILLEACAKVAAAGDLHRMLTATSGADVDLPDYLGKIARGAIEALSVPGEVVLSLSFDGRCAVSADAALKLGLVIGELIINAIKYAHPATGARGRIEIGCASEADGAMTVWVADDGVGLPEGFDPERNGGLGIQTLHLIAQDLGAQLSFEDSALGLTVRLRAPKLAVGFDRLEVA